MARGTLLMLCDDLEVVREVGRERDETQEERTFGAYPATFVQQELMQLYCNLLKMTGKTVGLVSVSNVEIARVL